MKVRIIKKPLWFYFLFYVPFTGFALSLAISGILLKAGSENPLLNAGVGGLFSALLVSTEVVAKKEEND